MGLSPPKIHELSSRKTRIDFVIAGAQKSGTTALHAFLSDHPQISMPERKEMHFFNRSAWADFSLPVWRDRQRALYHRNFPNFPDNRWIYGEATPHYMTWCVALDRIQSYNPNTRIIVILRHPVERAYSHWNMEVQRGLVASQFEDAIEYELTKAASNDGPLDKVHSFIQRGFYTAQVESIWQRFGKAQTLVLKHRSLLQNHTETMAQVHAFLGVDNRDVPAQTVHGRAYSDTMNDTTRERLLNLYAKDVQQIEGLLGWDCSDWKR